MQLNLKLLFVVVLKISSSKFLVNSENVQHLKNIQFEGKGFSKLLNSFSDCITTIVFTNKSSQITISSSDNPIIITCENNRLNINRLGLQSGIRKSLTCWAILVFKPEDDFHIHSSLIEETESLSHTIAYINLKRFLHHSHITHSQTYRKYIIWITTRITEFQSRFHKILAHDIYYVGPGDLFFINLAVNNNIQLQYEIVDYSDITEIIYLKYYQLITIADDKGVDSYASDAWESVNCLNISYKKCFNRMQIVSQKASELNKHFWIAEAWIDKRAEVLIDNPKLNYYSKSLKRLQNNVQISKSSTKKTIYNIALKLTFEQFLPYLILEDVLKTINLSRPIDFYRTRFILRSNHALRFSSKEHFILSASKSYSFLSCHGVNSEISLMFYLDPFDTISWVYILIALAVVHTVISIAARNWDIFNAFLLFGILLEDSVLGLKQLSTISKKFIAIKVILASWTILGIVLTNYYKSYFTVENTIPKNTVATWSTILDIKNFDIFISVHDSELNLKNYETGKTSAFSYSNDITYRLLRAGRYKGPSRTITSYAQVAQNLYDKENKKLKFLLYRYPKHFVNNLTTCHKVAYLDTVENIRSILPFLNDNNRGILFAKGDDNFLPSYYGWTIKSIRNNYVLKRFVGIITSGIYYNWENWYKIHKPRKLFQHYANWTRPVFETTEKFNFSSKVFITFYLLPYGYIFSILICFSEIFINRLNKCLF